MNGFMGSNMAGWWGKDHIGWFMANWLTKGHCVRAVVDDFGTLIAVDCARWRL